MTAFEKGFIKRAVEMGLSEDQGKSLLKNVKPKKESLIEETPLLNCASGQMSAGGVGHPQL